jgi:hypothetical protein
MKSNNLTFAQVGEIFDDATTRMVGGINDHNQGAILRDLAKVQNGIETLLAKNPGDFQGIAAIHAQNIIDQINLEVTAIKSIGSDPFAAKYINDVQRDLIDIVQGDQALLTLANQGNHHGFDAVPDLIARPAQFQGDAVQTEFMKGFVTTSQNFAERANALADHPDGAAAQQLIGEMQGYAANANAFTMQQGGLYSARFNNEFASDGVNGTATRALIDGLQTGNADKVHAAAEVLVANAADVAGNMLGIGDTVPQIGNGIPAHFNTFAEVGTVFNDATAKLVGGVYDGNRQSIHNDLAAAQQGIKDLLVEHADQFQGRAGTHAQQIIGLLDRELKVVDAVDAGPNAATQLNTLHSRIIGIVQGDAALATLATADDAAGFMALPGLLKGHGYMPGNGHGSGGGHDGGHGHGAAQVAMSAIAPEPDPLAHIFTPLDLHHG